MRGLEYPGAGRRWDIGLVESGLWVYSVAAGTGVVSRRGIYRKRMRLMMWKEVDLSFAVYAVSRKLPFITRRVSWCFMMRGLFVLWLIFDEHGMQHCGLDVTPSKSTFLAFLPALCYVRS